MARREMAKWELWRERLERFSASGMTVTQFCRAERLSIQSFYQWRRKLKSDRLHAIDSDEQQPPVFQQVVVTPGLGSAGLRVRLASGAEIEVAAGHLEVIRAVIGELARAECQFAAGENAAC